MERGVYHRHIMHVARWAHGLCHRLSNIVASDIFDGQQRLRNVHRGGAELQLEMGVGAGVSLIREEEEARLRRVCEVLLCGAHATGRKEEGRRRLSWEDVNRVQSMTAP